MAEMKAAQLDTLAQGMTAVELDGTKLLLVRDGDRISALEGTCPHAKAPLEKGVLCGGRIICPWHMGAFDAATGALLEPVAMRSLHRYPVRVAAGEVLVDTAPMPPAKPAGRFQNHVFALVGSGAAASMAAVTLRDHGFDGRLVMVGPEAEEPLDRTQLSKMAIASAEFDRSTLPLQDAAAAGLERVVARVTAIHPADQTLQLSNGASLRYDAALLATGAAPLPLKVPGADLPHVCTLRTLSDVDHILQHVREGRHAVVIGTSFIGMEATSALIERKLRVTVVGKDELPFVKNFGARVGAAMLDLHRSKGVRFQLNAKVDHIDAAAVVLQDGTRIAADLVVVGVGVSPAIGYAPDLARAEDGGLRTDQALQVAPGIWAAGDIASPEGWPRIEHWRLAQQHGQAAAFGMLGEAANYQGVPFFWTAQHGKRLQYLGHAESWDEIVYDGDVEAFDFTAWYLTSGKVAAALICGRDQAAAALSWAMRQPLSLDQARAAAGSP